MRIAVTRSGGLAGIVRRAEIDSADDPAAVRLVAAIATADEPAPPADRGADRFVYDVRLGDRVIRVGERDLSGPLRELVDRVLAQGRRPPAPPVSDRRPGDGA